MRSSACIVKSPSHEPHRIDQCILSIAQQIVKKFEPAIGMWRVREKNYGDGVFVKRMNPPGGKRMNKVVGVGEGIN